MKPESLLGISLELIEAVALPGAFPADARVGRFFRKHRFLGSRDRRSIGGITYAWLRFQIRARALWRQWASAIHPAIEGDDEIGEIERHLSIPPDPESTVDDSAQRDAWRDLLRHVYLFDVLALLREGLLSDVYPWSFGETLDLARKLVSAPEKSPRWAELASLVEEESFPKTVDIPAEEEAALAVEYSLPSWVARSLTRRPNAKELAASFLQPASVDIRVNLRLMDRASVRKNLQADVKKPVELTPLSPLGLRLQERVNLTGTRASRNNWIEVQDEGSQIAVLAADPEHGMTIIDACAGNGGKTLALADLILPSRDDPDYWSGEIHACDISKKKISELGRRAKESGLENRLSLWHIYPAGPLPDGLPQADLVLVDAPCSGLGTLRRNPELKRRHREEDISEFAATQMALLDRFSALVKEGGRLVYVTCSFLEEEGERVADAFAENHIEFRASASKWASTFLPPECIDGHKIRLDPVLTQTDAFFLASWKKEGRGG